MLLQYIAIFFCHITMQTLTGLDGEAQKKRTDPWPPFLGQNLAGRLFLLGHIVLADIVPYFAMGTKMHQIIFILH